jgi:hypothetical protein
MVTIPAPIRKNERDPARRRKYLAIIMTRRGPLQYVGNLKRHVAEAQRSNDSKKAAR